MERPIDGYVVAMEMLLNATAYQIRMRDTITAYVPALHTLRRWITATHGDVERQEPCGSIALDAERVVWMWREDFMESVERDELQDIWWIITTGIVDTLTQVDVAQWMWESATRGASDADLRMQTALTYRLHNEVYPRWEAESERRFEMHSLLNKLSRKI